jgi:hypothetical protein
VQVKPITSTKVPSKIGIGCERRLRIDGLIRQRWLTEGSSVAADKFFAGMLFTISCLTTAFLRVPDKRL